MPDYRIRPATLDDVETLVHHRIAMFTEMGTPLDADAVATEPAHRRRRLARRVLEAIHAWCREAGIRSAALNSSPQGQPLYESLGYQVRTNPMMTCELGP